MRNTADPTQVKAQNRRERRALERQRNDVKFVMGDERGRRFVWDILTAAGIHRSSMTGNAYTYFNEGQRNLGLLIETRVFDACPDAYLLAMQEAKKLQKREDETELAESQPPEKENADG